MATNPYPYQPITTPPGGLLASAVGTAQQPLPPIDPDQYENDDVVEQLNAITAADSGYMQQARTSGLQTAGRRGLLNSSMAVGASQAAAIQAAAPLAIQNSQNRAGRNQVRLDATFQTRRQEAGFAHDESMQSRDIASRESMLDKQLASEEARLGRQLTAQEQSQIRDITANREAQLRDLSSRSELQAREIAAEADRLGRQLTAQETQQIRELQSRAQLATQELEGRQSLLQTELANRTQLQQQEIASQMERLLISDAGETARANLSAATQTQLAELNNLNENQRAALSYYLQTNSIYAQSLASLYGNKDLPAPLRDQAIQNFTALRNSGANLPALLFGTSTNWGTGTPTVGDAPMTAAAPFTPVSDTLSYYNPPATETGPAVAGQDYPTWEQYQSGTFNGRPILR